MIPSGYLDIGLGYLQDTQIKVQYTFRIPRYRFRIPSGYIDKGLGYLQDTQIKVQDTFRIPRYRFRIPSGYLDIGLVYLQDTQIQVYFQDCSRQFNSLRQVMLETLLVYLSGTRPFRRFNRPCSDQHYHLVFRSTLPSRVPINITIVDS